MIYGPNHIWTQIAHDAELDVPARLLPPRGSREVPAATLRVGDVLPDVGVDPLRVVALGTQNGCLLVYVAPADARRPRATRRLRYAPGDPVRVARSAYLPALPEEA